MPDYHYKDAVAMAYDANKKRLRLEGRLILDSLLNEAIAEMTEQFNAALAEGRILEITGSREELKGYLRTAARRELGPGEDDAV